MKIVDQPFQRQAKTSPSRPRRMLSWLAMPFVWLAAIGRRLPLIGRLWKTTPSIKRKRPLRDTRPFFTQLRRILYAPISFIVMIFGWIAPRRRVRNLQTNYRLREKSGGRMRPFFNRAATLSISRRLPLTYALVALVATFALSAATLTTLNTYYEQQQYSYLNRVGRVTVEALRHDFSNGEIDAEALTQKLIELGDLTQTRMRLVDPEGNVLADSGGITRARIVVMDGNRFNVEAISLSTDGVRTVTQFDGLIPIPSEHNESTLSQFGVPIPNVEIERIIESLGDLPGAQPIEIVVESEDNSIIPFDLLRPNEPFTSIEERQFGLRPTYRWGIQWPVVLEDGAIVAFLDLDSGLSNNDEILNTVTGALAVSSLFAIMLAAFIGWRMSKRISQPILALAQTTGQMAEGDLSVRAEIDREDEIGRLANSFNLMAERVENTVETLRQFVGDAAHEINTPITALRNTLDVAAEEVYGEGERNSAELATLIDDSRLQINRLETLTQGLLNLSRIEANESARYQPINIVNLILKTGELYAAQAEQAGLDFWMEMPELPAVAMGDERQIKRAISNLIENAIKFTPEGGTITVGVTPNKGWLRIWVQDTGIGIPEDEIEQIFSRFNRARNTAAIPGNGLGLAMVKAIAEQHDGFISAENASAGTLFTLSLPSRE